MFVMFVLACATRSSKETAAAASDGFPNPAEEFAHKKAQAAEKKERKALCGNNNGKEASSKAKGLQKAKKEMKEALNRLAKGQGATPMSFRLSCWRFMGLHRMSVVLTMDSRISIWQQLENNWPFQQPFSQLYARYIQLLMLQILQLGRSVFFFRKKSEIQKVHRTHPYTSLTNRSDIHNLHIQKKA